MKNKKMLIIICTAIAIILLSIIVFFIFNKKEKVNEEKLDESVENLIEGEEYIMLSINPKIMLKLNGKVISEVYRLNDDAQIFLNDEIEGTEISDGTKKIYDILLKNNYIKDDTVINLTALRREKAL